VEKRLGRRKKQRFRKGKMKLITREGRRDEVKEEKM
jgi:hypothetical protein